MDGHTLYLGSCGQLDHIGLNIMTWILSLIKKHSSWALEAIIRSVESRVAIPHWKVYLQVYMAVGLLAGPFLMLLQDLEELNV